MSGSHYHLSGIWHCKTKPIIKFLHSANISSSHTHNLLLHLHASPPSSQQRMCISATVLNLFVAESNRQVKRLHKGTSPNHLSYKKKIFTPSPTPLDTLSVNQPPSASPTPSLIFAISRHHEETLRPPTSLPPHHTSPPTPYTVSPPTLHTSFKN